MSKLSGAPRARQGAQRHQILNGPLHLFCALETTSILSGPGYSQGCGTVGMDGHVLWIGLALTSDRLGK